MQQNAQGLYKGLPLNVMAYTKEVFDALQSKDATIKINALFNYLRPGHQSDLTKQENLIEFVKKCATRKIVDKIKSNSGVEETEEAYLKRIAQDVYNTAKITENIRLGIDENGDVHFYVKFGKKKDVRDEYEINTEDTLTVVREIYQQFIIEIEDEEKPAMNYVLGVSTIKKVTEDDQRKRENKLLKETLEEVELINCKLQQSLIDKEEITRQADEEKAKRELEFQLEVEKLKHEIEELRTSLHNKVEESEKQVSELTLNLREQKLVNDQLQQTLKDVQEENRLTVENKVKRLMKMQAELEQAQEENKTLQSALQEANDDEGDDNNASKLDMSVSMSEALEEQEMITQQLQQSLIDVEQEAKKAKEQYDKREHKHRAELEAKQKKIKNLLNCFHDKKKKQKQAVITIKNKFLEQRAENDKLHKNLLETQRSLKTYEEEKIQTEQVLKKTQQEIENFKCKPATIVSQENKEVNNLKQALEEQEQITLEMQQSLFVSQQDIAVLREEKALREQELESEIAKLKAEMGDLKNSFMEVVLDNSQNVALQDLKGLLEQLQA